MIILIIKLKKKRYKKKVKKKKINTIEHGRNVSFIIVSDRNIILTVVERHGLVSRIKSYLLNPAT